MKNRNEIQFSNPRSEPFWEKEPDKIQYEIKVEFKSNLFLSQKVQFSLFIKNGNEIIFKSRI